MKNQIQAGAGLVKPVLCAALALFAWAAHADVPGEVLGLSFCANNNNCLQWSATSGAASYNVYVGGGTRLPNVLNSNTDSCLLGNFASTTTGSFALVEPALGGLEWFLVTGVNVSGEGSPGNATAGARVLNSSGACGSHLVINEVDYDQIGTDTQEFIEVLNPTPVSQPLPGVSLILINGANNLEYRRVDLSSAASLLEPGQYLVVADMSVPVPSGEVVIRLAGSDNVQNGAPDGIALFNTATNTMIDALSYEGSITMAVITGAPGTYSLVEGSATAAADSSSITGSLVRLPNGKDTNTASSDWAFSSNPTPGAANVP